jgi:hypothetical protein
MKTDLDQLMIDCRAALGEDKPQAALRDVVQRAVSTSRAIMGTNVVHGIENRWASTTPPCTSLPATRSRRRICSGTP